MNVCILATGFSRYLGPEPEQWQMAGLCGLLHDVGKSQIPLDIINKPNKHNPDEFKIMNSHTTLGKELLLSADNPDLIAADVAFNHHERESGGGYPRGIKAEDCQLYTKIVTLVDVYDAITSNRCYDDERPSMTALDIIYKNRSVQFNEELAVEFINSIGVYPPGAIVEMTNGEVGIVIRTNVKNRLQPKIMLMLDTEKNPLPRERIINLLSDSGEKTETAYAISTEISNGSFGIELKDLVERGLVLKSH